MTRIVALERALKALYSTANITNGFDHGGAAGHEVVSIIAYALRAEFGDLREKHEFEDQLSVWQ